MIKVLVVEDAPTVRDFLVGILQSDPEITVVGCAHDGQEAIALTESLHPDVITMDLVMPKMGGHAAISAIMKTRPTPIIVVTSAVDSRDKVKTFEIIELGALAVFNIPKGIGHQDHHKTAQNLIDHIKLLSEVKVIRRYHPQPMTAKEVPLPIARPPKAIGIGASTGGPPILKTILSEISPDLPAPLLIVQHMAPGFMKEFVDWLSLSSTIPLHLARNGEFPQAAHGYFAPDDYHLTINGEGKIHLAQNIRHSGFRPSVSVLFESLEKAYGREAMGILLTGMGRDGVDGLALLKRAGAVTIAQDKESSLVHSMPGEAIRAGVVSHILSPQQIIQTLNNLSTSSPLKGKGKRVENE